MGRPGWFELARSRNAVEGFVTILAGLPSEGHRCGDETKEIKRAVLYLRVSTLDQHSEAQLHDLEQPASQCGLNIIEIYEDRITVTGAWRPSLYLLMAGGG